MSYPIASAATLASSFTLKTAAQASLLISSISKVAFLSLACFAASFQVMPVILPITLCLLVGLIVSSSLIRNLPSSCCVDPHYIPHFHQRITPYRHYSFPVYEPRPPVFSSHVYPRNDFVGERGTENCRPRPIFMPSRPSFASPPIIRCDRVGERSSF